MLEFNEWLNEQFKKDSELKKEYDALELERKFWSAYYDARSFLSEERLLRKLGISKNHLYRICEGRDSPTITTMQRLADILNCDLKIEFIPKNKQS